MDTDINCINSLVCKSISNGSLLSTIICYKAYCCWIGAQNNVSLPLQPLSPKALVSELASCCVDPTPDNCGCIDAVSQTSLSIVWCDVQWICNSTLCASRLKIAVVFVHYHGTDAHHKFDKKEAEMM